MVLAAGLGTRLQPFTLKTPKALMPLLGVPCIDFSLLQLLAAGIETAVVNVHSHSDQMRSHIQGWNSRHALDFKISDESDLLLGSAGGFRKALPLLNSGMAESVPFFALNADVISCVDLSALEKRHFELRQQHGVEMTLVLAKGKTISEQEGLYTEILVNESTGLITGIGSKKSKVPFYTGTAVFETDAFRHLKEGIPSEFVPEVLLPKIAEGKVGFFWMDGIWFDVGSPNLWWKSHFSLLKEFEKASLPSWWMKEIHMNLSKVRISVESGVVDYDSNPACDQNCICYQGVRHAL